MYVTNLELQVEELTAEIKELKARLNLQKSTAKSRCLLHMNGRRRRYCLQIL
jgi:predicted ester cyclase